MRYEDIDLDLMRCFCIIAETRNFTLAGDRLGRSQSAISMRMNKLETLIGTPLFRRDSRNVTLTARGEMLLPRAQALLALGEETLASVRTPVLSGRLRVGILDYLAPQQIPRITSLIQRRLPDAEIQFRLGLSRHLMALLDRGEIDVTLAMHDPTRGEEAPYSLDPLVWARGLQGPIDPADLVPVPLCLLDDPCFYRTAAMEALAGQGRSHRETLSASNVFAVRSAVVNGMGLTVLGASSLGPDLVEVESSLGLPELPVMKLAIYGNDNRRSLFADVAADILGDYVRIVES